MKKKILLIGIMTGILMSGCSGKETEANSEPAADEIVTENVTETLPEVTEEVIQEPEEEKKDRPEVVVKELKDVTLQGDNIYTCTYDDVKHDFIVELPKNSENAPLVVMLHGYGESAEGFKGKVHFEERACEEGYGVVYVTGAPDPNDKTSANGWNSGIGEGGNEDVGFLIAIARYLQDEYGFDKERTFAVGFSNGAFMIHRLAMEAQDTYSALVSVAGMMPEAVWEYKNDTNNVSFMQITGEKDDVVPKNSDGSAAHSNAPAIEDVMTYWAFSNGLVDAEISDIGKRSTITKHTGEGNKKQVWDIFVKDARHSWPVETLTGIDTNGIILEFLNTQ